MQIYRQRRFYCASMALFMQMHFASAAVTGKLGGLVDQQQSAQQVETAHIESASAEDFDDQIREILISLESPCLSSELRQWSAGQITADYKFFREQALKAENNGHFASAAQYNLYAAREALAQHLTSDALRYLDDSNKLRSKLSPSEQLDLTESILALMESPDAKNVPEWFTQLNEKATQLLNLVKTDKRLTNMRTLHARLRLAILNGNVEKMRVLDASIPKISLEQRAELDKLRQSEFSELSQKHFDAAEKTADQASRLAKIVQRQSFTNEFPELITKVLSINAEKHSIPKSVLRQLNNNLDHAALNGGPIAELQLQKLPVVIDVNATESSPLSEYLQRQGFKILLKKGGFLQRANYVKELCSYLNAIGKPSEANLLVDAVATHLENILRLKDATDLRKLQLSEFAKRGLLDEAAKIQAQIDQDSKQIRRSSI